MRRIMWGSLADQRPRRELYWLSLMPRTRVTAVGNPRPWGDVEWQPSRYRRPIKRFVEAGAFAWLRDLDGVAPEFDWCASLELHSLVSGQVAGYARRHRIRRAVVTWSNDPRHPLYRLPPYRQAFLRSRDADLIVCFFEAARQHCLDLGIDSGRCSVVYPGVDTELYRPAQEQVEEPVACFVSPLAENKGIDRVLDAFKLVLRRLPDARLIVVGRGPLEAEVRRAVSETDQAVEYIGAGDAHLVSETLRRSAVFVTAPRANRVWNEQFGLAYLEAMASGLPVVTTACGTNYEAVAPPNVRVEDDAEALSEALLAFLEDPQLRSSVGALNRRNVLDRHELRTQCASLGDAFRRVEQR